MFYWRAIIKLQKPETHFLINYQIFKYFIPIKISLQIFIYVIKILL